MASSTVAVPTARYGCAPAPYGHDSAPAFTAVVRTASPSSDSEYSTRARA